MSYTKALKKTHCKKSVETTIRERRLLFAGGVQLTSNERLTRRVMLGAMADGENPGPDPPENNCAQCLADDLVVFQVTEGSTESSSLLFGVERVLWPRPAKKSGKWYRRSSKRRTVSWRGGTWTRRREAGCATQPREPRAATRRGGEGGGSRTIQLSMNAETK